MLASLGVGVDRPRRRCKQAYASVWTSLGVYAYMRVGASVYMCISVRGRVSQGVHACRVATG